MWECSKCEEKHEDSFDVCWNCGASRDGKRYPIFEKVADVPEHFMALEDDHDSEAMTCPFCGDKMIRGHIWVKGGEEGGDLNWQEGSRLKSGLFGKIADEGLLTGGFFVAPVKQAFRCSSCGALLTNFEGPN